MEASRSSSDKVVTLSHDGVNRPYVLHVPSTFAARPAPLLVELHGRGIDAERFDQLTGFGSLAEDAGFVLALPSALGEMWNDGRSNSSKWTGTPDDVGYLAAVIDDATQRISIDERRVYVVGMSNGATMAGRLVCELPGRIAGVAQVGGTAAADIATSSSIGRTASEQAGAAAGFAASDAAGLGSGAAAGVRQGDAGGRETGPVPILNIHGTADDYAPYAGGVRHSLRGRVVLRNPSRPALGVDEWARFWVAANRASSVPIESTLPPDTTIRTWHGSTPSCDVVFYRVEGGGHTWPGSRITLPGFLFGRTSRTFDAAQVCWNFLAAHSR